MNRLMDIIIECGIIDEQQRDIYSIAITTFFFSIITWGSLIILGFIFQKLYGSVLFMLFFIPLRIYAGGFHQNTRLKCYTHSMVIFLLLMLAAGTVVQDWILYSFIPIALICFITIWCLSPLEALNKPLNPAERKHHRNAARIILVIELIVLILLKWKRINSILYFAFAAIIVVAFQLLLGLVEGKLLSRKNEL